MSSSHLSNTTYASLDLPASVHSGLEAAGFSHCTPIQALCLPYALQGQDVAGQAQTGTGKTAAFLVATFNHLLRHPVQTQQPRALIVSPTRELAVQIHKDALLLGQHTGLRITVCYGGADYEKQRREVQAGVDIIIGTPGRIIDYLKQNVFDLKSLQVAVLDEADRMFDLGFISDVRYLFRRMPPADKRLSMLFSATLSLRVTELAYEHMNNPLSLLVESDSVAAENVQQVLYHPANSEKVPLLVGLLRKLTPARGLIFVNTKRAAERIEASLLSNDFHVGVLSGDVQQRKRLSLLRRFQTGELPLLIATDVAARGLHIPAVTHVFNFDLPQNAEDYVHRIGRTARAGESGHAISFACEDYAFSLPDIEAYLGQAIAFAPLSDDLLPSINPPAKSSKPFKAKPFHSADPKARKKSRPRRRKAKSPSV